MCIGDFVVVFDVCMFCLFMCACLMACPIVVVIVVFVCFCCCYSCYDCYCLWCCCSLVLGVIVVFGVVVRVCVLVFVLLK